ncbi:TPA: bifunctional folylpolyglutamate synthase/dihydrofolate synthase [Listeria innocua]|uniref:Dihydrofolate synthase/folylpolyglutamate synthase n=1 Tax=Listeria innocua serovar 6a (strain ATCC BAA-680 / CLIP 11262) TaxID=272626 RepID=Q92BG3_LISIN|nr:folylpolyglutamate synthase/dihydrofolate synthase family protein [Listeria innocua]ECC1682080.1 bifunctional folylpolyglutamate synthase/dihydrofolate synthase [Listeria innocua]EEQ0536881.1 bifunctional folylpolyglutamate synthase/dihydrofolate synthase [Listeria innocua]EHD9219793.1 bifunctional folylpolyglutamate synthase/dihydrofolate synthase [Listeria innocua]EHF3596279.1 bifunctional folylpolyglutamate synthase/dihydrofolate synthase [Listeria innocua]EHF3599242.1 bifunctional folyl
MALKSYQEALDWIHGTLRLGIKPGLARMEYIMEKLNHPEKANKWVHIAGTNGKGSTLTFIRSSLEEAGYKTGTFTSPYIETFNERISVNGIPVSDQMIVDLANRIKPIAEELEKTVYGPPSEFEIITAMMFLCFAEYESIDIGIIEVGLGGRLDSTNVLTPLISVITTIGMDHMEFLGNSIEQIAGEKAGIIKPGIPVISGVIQKEAQEVIINNAVRNNSNVAWLNKDFCIQNRGDEITFRTSHGDEIPDITIGLLGIHQLNNAAVAIKVLQYLNTFSSYEINQSAIKQGLKKAFWPGRMELLDVKPFIMLDGAHNPEGVTTFANSIKTYPGHKKIIVSILKDKNYQEMIALLKTIPDTEILLTTFDYPRAMSDYEVTQIGTIEGISTNPNWKQALDDIKEIKNDTKFFVTGSLYFISEVRKYLLTSHN